MTLYSLIMKSMVNINWSVHAILSCGGMNGTINHRWSL